MRRRRVDVEHEAASRIHRHRARRPGNDDQAAAAGDLAAASIPRSSRGMSSTESRAAATAPSRPPCRRIRRGCPSRETSARDAGRCAGCRRWWPADRIRLHVRLRYDDRDCFDDGAPPISRRPVRRGLLPAMSRRSHPHGDRRRCARAAAARDVRFLPQRTQLSRRATEWPSRATERAESSDVKPPATSARHRDGQSLRLQRKAHPP